MKEEYISLKTAKLAKEKKFDIYVKSSYVEYLKTQKSDNSSFRMKKGEIEINDGYFINYGGHDYSCKHYIMYARPTQALLQKWLREKHKIIVLIIYNFNLIYYSKSVQGGNTGEKYNSYEEALEAGLQEAFKFI